ncbi:hypothetical protein WJT86_07985 [Microvirga sp. W0021]|uniref:Uncharacterized protein n=1 Tax=Hohaiivirga grylli TaxID=3133970 RepID=A0ABV0BN86_9HYPH
MIGSSLRIFIDRMIDKGNIDDADVALLREEICREGISNRSEADALIALDRLVHVPEAWGDFLVKALLSFTLRQTVSTGGMLSHDYVSWLISSLDIGVPTERAFRIAAAIVSETHCVDEYLRRFAKGFTSDLHALDVRTAA